MMEDFDFLSREELLEGLPAKRASALLFAIESRTAHFASRSQQAMELFVTEGAAEERELAFLEAFAMGREPPIRITIQDIEHYAPQWTSLVPDNPSVQRTFSTLNCTFSSIYLCNFQDRNDIDRLLSGPRFNKGIRVNL
jgi:hypothetical protein